MQFFTALAFILGIATSQTVLAAVTHSVGVARDAKDQSVRYVEHHQYLLSGDHLVKYFDPAGNIMLSKTITYPGLPQHPEIVQTDFTNDTKVESYNSARSITMVRNVSGFIEQFKFPLNETTIVDAGFDNFLRSNWHKFGDGETQIFQLAVAGQESLLKVQVTKQPSSGDKTAFTIKPKNFFIRLLVSEMRLVYDRERRLMAYAGPTNQNLPAGQSRDVTIEFKHYTSPDKLAKPLSQWVPAQ